MIKKIAFLILGLLLLLTTVQGSLALTYRAYGYSYSAGGYPTYDGHQYDSYGPNGWRYSYHAPSVGYYAYGAYGNYAPYYAGYYNSYPAYGNYYGSYSPYYYRGWGSPWFTNYWPYNYRVYQRWYP